MGHYVPDVSGYYRLYILLAALESGDDVNAKAGMVIIGLLKVFHACSIT